VIDPRLHAQRLEAELADLRTEAGRAIETAAQSLAVRIHENEIIASALADRARLRDVEAEQGLVGTALFCAQEWPLPPYFQAWMSSPELRAVDRDDFDDRLLGAFFFAAVGLYDSGRVPHPRLVARWLEGEGLGWEPNLSRVLGELAESLPIDTRLELARRVRANGHRRRVVRRLDQLTRDVRYSGLDAQVHARLEALACDVGEALRGAP
jgi:hypothetical protein